MSAPTGQDPHGITHGRLPGYTVVIPTTGSGTLTELLKSLDHAAGPRPEQVLIVDDRQEQSGPALEFGEVTLPITVLPSGRRGAAAARNAGWQHSRSDWIAFLGENSVIAHDWPQQLVTDLGRCDASDAGSAAVIRPAGKAPRSNGEPRWDPADLAYRRAALAEVGGFDEDFRHGRDGSDLALRLIDAGYRISTGRRVTERRGSAGDRPGWLAGVRGQRGNTDDALMLARHGRNWRRDVGAGRGHLAEYAVTTVAGLSSLGLLIGGRRRAAAVAAGVWAGFTGRFAVGQLQNGATRLPDVGRAVADSALIPPAACFHRLRGELDVRTAARSSPPQRASSSDLKR